MSFEHLPGGSGDADLRLRKNFTGDPAHTVNFMKYIAEEVREFMAQLGFRPLTK